MSQQGRIIGIGGIFFKSANQQQMKEWYAKHLGPGDSGHDKRQNSRILPWHSAAELESQLRSLGLT